MFSIFRSFLGTNNDPNSTSFIKREEYQNLGKATQCSIGFFILSIATNSV
jgi:hypothetical protein